MRHPKATGWIQPFQSFNRGAAFKLLDHGFSNAPFSDPTAGRSLWRRVHGDRESLLGHWPFDRPAEWVEWVNAAQTEDEIEALRKCVNRGTPYGAETWKTQIAATLGLKSTLQPRGRPG